jgi:hypothetical protein
MSDIVTSRIFVDGEKGITAAKLNDIVASSVIQPAFYTSKPTAGTADPTDIALILKSGAYAQVPVSTLGGSATQAQIWSTRLRSFNAVGNPTFEVDQRNVGNVVAAPNGLIIDRWAASKGGTMAISAGQRSAAASEVLLPGTNFAISRSFLRITLTTAQASLGASDNINIYSQIEGPQFRELQYDVHSISVLVRSSVANLNFGIALRDAATTTKSLLKLATIPVANTWTLLTFPNLPVFPAGNFVTTPGSMSYYFGICLAAGVTFTAPANDTWQNGNFIAAAGQSNFAASPVNSTFDIAFVQHEPGSVCSTLMDKPFVQNLDECLRYYQKSYDYPTAVGALTQAGARAMLSVAASSSMASGPLSFHKPMAKLPTVTCYNHATGAVNSVRDGTGADHTPTPNSVGLSGFPTMTLSPVVSAATMVYVQYTADTGW